MPIEIKELHIRISINSSVDRQSAGERMLSGSVHSIVNEEAKEALIAECVEAVLKILHNKMER